MLSGLLQRITTRTNPAVIVQQTQPAPTLNNHTTSYQSDPPLKTQPAKAFRMAKLIMVTAENNNKYYEMRENDTGTFTVQYGRVGGTHSTATYPLAQWDKKFREKVAKGYVDQTHLFAETSIATDAGSIENPAVRGLMSRLLELANRSIFQNYVVTAQEVTRKQVDAAQRLLDDLADMMGPGLDTDTFNRRLLDLFKTIPRKMGKVGEHLLTQPPQSAAELQTLRDGLASEQDTLDVMRGQVELNQPTSQSDQPPVSLLETMNLTMEPVTDKRLLTLIKRMMGPDVDKFDAAFSVCQANTQAAFDEYVNGQKNRKTQLLWHGSRSENWLSILKTGLVLRPANAVITGKMFGYGIYFADQFSKSLNYTSLHGSVWAKGTHQEGYLAIYEVHVGKQLVVNQHEHWHMQLDADRLKQIDPSYDSVYAQRGVSLLKNEFIVYNQAQCTIRYMVRIKV
ncbi:ADP-ribose polymerase [Fibrisoma montanum]|uniref:ADP-ribose polymerase n=1 Tax=Fibrisoma montanum TaxID=2305895 RepID=A0A418LYX9_9BACT|nr:ADP-ribose polymerase [Fibrisoma montanum]RIV18490.1 ADP-ribose polymerase [Fibrisoma montanum]